MLILRFLKHFYNFPVNDPLYQSQRTFWRCQEILRDMADTAWNTGSGWILRRQALADIGGFPTDCLVEDVCSSMLILAEGWKTSYIGEALQYGLMPDTYAGHIKQLTRWVSLHALCYCGGNVCILCVSTTNQRIQEIGGCQLAIRMRLYTSKSQTKLLTPIQRLQGFANGISVLFDPALRTLSLMITPFFLFTGVKLVYFQSSEQLRLLLRIQCGIVLGRWLHDCHLSILTGYQLAIREGCNAVSMAPCRFS